MNKRAPTLNTTKLEKKRRQYLAYQLEIYQSILQRCFRQIEEDNQKSVYLTVFDLPCDESRYPYDNLCRYFRNKLKGYGKTLSYQLIDHWKEPGVKQVIVHHGDDRPEQADLDAKDKSRVKKSSGRTPYVKKPKIPREVHRMYQ